MVHSPKLSFSAARLRAPVFACLILLLSAGCENNESLGPEGNIITTTTAVPAPEVASIAFAGGIPIGNFNQPITEFGSLFNGAHSNTGPSALVSYLAQVRARGGKVILALAGSPKYYTEGGRFSLGKWKARVDRYKNVNFDSYISDGTVIGHYMIDEPNDRANWNGTLVSTSTLEEMGRYSKQRWPKMATIVRTDPSYLSGGHRYVDAAWAQYLHRRGDPQAYLRSVVAEAQRKGLQLVVGLNIVHGGNPQGTPMSASEVESWGSAMLGSTYPCAFINWKYVSSYMNSSSIRSAMNALRRKAESRSTKSCRSS